MADNSRLPQGTQDARRRDSLAKRISIAVARDRALVVPPPPPPMAPSSSMSPTYTSPEAP